MRPDPTAVRGAVLLLAQQKLKRHRLTGTDQVEAYCPFPHDRPKTRRSFYISTKTGLWICHSCGRRGNLPKLYISLGLGMDSDIEALLKQMRPEDIIPDPIRIPRGQDILPMEIAFLFAIRGPRQLLDSGFSKTTLINHLVGIDEEAERFTFPIWSKDGKLRGISGRTLDPDGQPKYLWYRAEDLQHIVGGQDVSKYVPRPHSYLWREEKIPKGTHVVIVEGFKAAMWMAQAGFDSVALMTTDISKDQLATLVSLNPSKITLVLDNDSAGIVGTDRVVRKVLGIAPVRIFDYPDINGGQSPDDLPNTEVQRGVSQAKTPIEWRNQNGLQQLLRHRI